MSEAVEAAAASSSNSSNDLWGDAMHDLRQPLQSLLLLTRVVADSEDAGMRDKGARYMEASLLKLQAMLEMLGRISRLGSGKASLVPQRCDLATELSGLEPTLGGLAELAGRGVRFVTRGCVSLTCDRFLLTSMIRGLVGHAARYGSGDIELGCEGNSIVCRFPVQGGAAPRRDVFIDLAPGALHDAVGEPVPGLMLVEQMAKLAGFVLSVDSGTGRETVLILARRKV